VPDCSGYRFRGSSAHDPMDPPNHRSLADLLAKKRGRYIGSFLRLPQQSHITVPTSITKGKRSRLPSGPVVPPLQSALPDARDASKWP
jgi:hypothetical protein